MMTVITNVFLTRISGSAQLVHVIPRFYVLNCPQDSVLFFHAFSSYNAGAGLRPEAKNELLQGFWGFEFRA